MRETFTYNGKRYDITGKTPQELADKIYRKKKALDEGSIVVNQNTLVEKWCDEWLDTYKKKSVGGATYYAYECRIRVHIIPVIGKMKIKDVKPIHLQRILNESMGRSRDHVKKIKYTLEQIFKRAYKNKLIATNIAEDLEMPTTVKHKRRAITDYEREHILKVAETHKSGLWIKTMLYCGLRPQETAGLQGRHINFKTNTLKIEQALKRHNNEMNMPKSKAGFRNIPIPNMLSQQLKDLKVEPYEYVFKNADGGHMTAGGLRSRWESFERALNISMGCTVIKNKVQPPYRVATDLVPYCLRHTYGTDLQSAGVEINVAKDLMGHEDITTTGNIYTELSSVSFEDARKKINKIPTPIPTGKVDNGWE